MQQHAATFIAETEAATGADLPQFVKDEFDAFLECGILAHGFLRLRCGARRMAQTAAHRVGSRYSPRASAPVGAVAADPAALAALAAQPKLVAPVLRVVHRVISCHLLGQAGLKADEADSGAVTLIQRFSSAVNLNIDMHCLVLDGVYRRGTDGAPEFVELPAPTNEALQTVLHKIIIRTMKLLTRGGGVDRKARPSILGRHRL